MLIFSQSQLQTIILDEMPKIRDAFRKFDTQQPYRPKLAILVCAKRISERFFPTKPEDADRNGNPKPGTVIDRGVTSIYHPDFFLYGTSQ